MHLGAKCAMLRRKSWCLPEFSFPKSRQSLYCGVFVAEVFFEVFPNGLRKRQWKESRQLSFEYTTVLDHLCPVGSEESSRVCFPGRFETCLRSKSWYEGLRLPQLWVLFRSFSQLTPACHKQPSPREAEIVRYDLIIC